MLVDWKDIFIIMAISGVVFFTIGAKVGYILAKYAVDHMVGEIYKQMDIDGKPFINESEKIDAKGDDWLNDPEYFLYH